ncbi:hypothetical protein bAD24_p00940 (plasmid) [Burkholderia sp. AD24]|nr:hypothetical protein bAD24_p00940 [Burkholderia sp. AD24]
MRCVTSSVDEHREHEILMTNIGTDSSAEPTIDRSTFTEVQWEALSLYVEARKRQRHFTVQRFLRSGW